MRLTAPDVLKGQGAIAWGIMTMLATATGKTRLLQNAMPKGLALVLHSKNTDWKIVMAHRLQNWIAPMGRQQGWGTTPRTTVCKREGWVKIAQTQKGNYKGQNVQKFLIKTNPSDTEELPDKQKGVLEWKYSWDLHQGLGFMTGKLQKLCD